MDAEADDDGDWLAEGLSDADGETDGLGERLGDSLDEGEGDPLGLSDGESEAEGESDDSPVPSGVCNISLNRHATTTLSSVSHASSNWSASKRQNFNRETKRKLVKVGRVASMVSVSFTVPSKAITRRNSIVPSQ